MSNIAFDYVFITNIPSFYKVNLYNALSSTLNIYVIFIANKSVIRKDDFFNQPMNFKHCFVNDVNFEERVKLKTFISVKNILRSISYRYVVFPGWEIKELFFLTYLVPKHKNAVAIESSILETKLNGLHGILKKLFLKRMRVGLPSGKLQKEIFDKVRFKGIIKYTHGVGILNDGFKISNKKEISIKTHQLKYLYVGRLSPEKNLELLCEVFKDNKKELTIVGYGPLHDLLTDKYGKDVNFCGQVNNKDLAEYYSMHDVLILPSKSEVWGLVIEEALACGLVIIVSDRVGSKDDLVISKNTGLTFDYSSKESLNQALNMIEANYEYYYNNVRNLDVDEINKEKIEPYIELLKMGDCGCEKH